jgi:hypothetical protein
MDQKGVAMLLDRFSPTAQAFISALLLIPTLVLFFANRNLPAPDSQILLQTYFTAFVVVVDVYLIVVLALTARGRAPRIRALIVAGITTVADGALTFAWHVPADYVIYVFGFCNTIIITAFVAAWGLARRQGWLWLLGLLPALIVIGLTQLWWVPTHHVRDWYDPWFVKVGVFTLGCLICWGVERFELGSPSKSGQAG